jgi:hypothetical protein
LVQASNLAVSEAVAPDEVVPTDILAVLGAEYSIASEAELLMGSEGDGASESWQLGLEGPCKFAEIRSEVDVDESMTRLESLEL